MVRTRLRFHARSRLGEVPTQQRTTPTGHIGVSTREATALDLAARPTDAGGLDNERGSAWGEPLAHGRGINRLRRCGFKCGMPTCSTSTREAGCCEKKARRKQEKSPGEVWGVPRSLERREPASVSLA